MNLQLADRPTTQDRLAILAPIEIDRFTEDGVVAGKSCKFLGLLGSLAPLASLIDFLQSDDISIRVANDLCDSGQGQYAISTLAMMDVVAQDSQDWIAFGGRIRWTKHRENREVIRCGAPLTTRPIDSREPDFEVLRTTDPIDPRARCLARLERREGAFVGPLDRMHNAEGIEQLALGSRIEQGTIWLVARRGVEVPGDDPARLGAKLLKLDPNQLCALNSCLLPLVVEVCVDEKNRLGLWRSQVLELDPSCNTRQRSVPPLASYLLRRIAQPEVPFVDRFKAILAIVQGGHFTGLFSVVTTGSHYGIGLQGIGQVVALACKCFLCTEQIGIEISDGIDQEFLAQFPAIDAVVGRPITDVETHHANGRWSLAPGLGGCA